MNDISIGPLLEPKEILSLLAYRDKLQTDIDSLRKNADILQASVVKINQAIELLRTDARLVPFVQTILDASKKLKLT